MKIENNKSMQQTTSSHNTHYPRIKLGFTWLALIPISAWAVSTIYIPLSSENLSWVTNWTATLTILLLMGLSVLFHVVAHLVAARITHNQTPDTLTIFLFGDAAQGWPGAASNWQEMLIAVAGPFINILLSGLAYLLWNAQINVFLNLIALFACIFNVWLFLINLLPAFPLDGGRVLKASLQDMLASRSSLAVLIRRFGIFFVLALAGWGIFLYLQNSRFSPQTALITFALVILLADGLRIQPAPQDAAASPPGRNSKLPWLRVLGMALLALIMLGAFCSTLLTDNGLDAPGVALSVEPMVNLPAQYRHVHKGTFLLTTVFTHAPILAGEWMLAQVNPDMRIVPPEVVVPKSTSIQQQAKEDYQMLDESEATAIAVGLRLAGYPSAMVGKGVRVQSILARESRKRHSTDRGCDRGLERPAGPNNR